MTRTLVVTVAAVLALVGCGGGGTSDSGNDAPAYDESRLQEIERRVDRNLTEIVEEDGDATVIDSVVHCVADTERTFTCSSSHDVELDSGGCGTIRSEQRGTFTADGEDASFKTTRTDEPEPC